MPSPPHGQQVCTAARDPSACRERDANLGQEPARRRAAAVRRARDRHIRSRENAVVLLSAPIDVVLERVADRANPFGSTSEQRAKIANDLATYEPHLRTGADHEIVTTTPLAEVVSTIERVARTSRRTNR